MAKALPDYLVNQVTTEARLAGRRMFTARSVATTDVHATTVLSALDFYSRFIGGKLFPYFQSNHGSSKPRDNRGTKVRGCANNRQNQPRKARSAQSGIAI
jgi:hypothetical protein